MNSKTIGYFAFPAEELNTLARLYNSWIQSLRTLSDDYNVRANEMYRYAADHALYKVETLDEGKDLSYPSSTVNSYLIRKAWSDKDHKVFSPEESRALANAIDALEGRLGYDKLLQRLARQSHQIPVESLRRYYDIYRNVLGYAVAEGAGFTWMVYTEGAEEALVQTRHKEAERVARLAAEPKGPKLTPQEQTAALQKFTESLRQAAQDLGLNPPPNSLPIIDGIDVLDGFDVLDGLDVLYHDGDDWKPMPGDELYTGVYTMTADALEPVLELCRQWEKAFADDHVDEALTLVRNARSIAFDDAEQVAEFLEDEERNAMYILYVMLMNECPEHVLESGIYRPDEARNLYQEIAGWEQRRGGERAVLDELTKQAFRHNRRVVEGCYQRWKTLLAAAANHGLGLAWILFTL